MGASRAQAVKEQAALNPELSKRINDIRVLKEKIADTFEGVQFDSHNDINDWLNSDSKTPISTNGRTKRPITHNLSVFPLVAVATLLGGIAMGYMTALHQYQPQSDSWVAQMVSYQEMYTKATIAAIEVRDENIEVTAARLSELLGSPLVIPDLVNEGLRFKRAQVLQSQNQPVIQLAYQDSVTGEPIAVCVTRLDKAATQTPKAGTDRSVNYMVWQEEHLGFVLVGRQKKSSLAKLVFAARTQQLTGLL